MGKVSIVERYRVATEGHDGLENEMKVTKKVAMRGREAWKGGEGSSVQFVK